MNIRRLQGLALIVSAVLGLVSLIGSENVVFDSIGIVAVVLFIFGIPAVNSLQPSGVLGVLGVGLMILAAIIVLGFRFGLVGDTPFAETLIIVSAVSGLVGRLVTGWVTIKKHVFSALLGWGLIAEGILNMAGFLDLPSLATVYSIGFTLLSSAVLLGYGIQTFQKSAPQPATS